jgi:hypothetical protein
MSVNTVHKGFSLQVVLSFFYIVSVQGKDGEILGEVACFYGLNDSFLEGLAKKSQLFIFINLGAMLEATSPSED